MNNPIYYFEIKVLYAYVELYINDLLVFAHYEDNGSIWVDWPINQYILKSGNQSFEIRIIPYKNNTNFSDNTLLEFGIHVLDESINDRKEILEKSEININQKSKTPLFIHKNSFNAEVPYENLGWTNSIDLSKENKDQLLVEILKWNSELLNIYRTSDISLYNKLYKDRDYEFSKAYYKTYQEGTKDIFHSKFKNLDLINNDLYELKFYGNNKLVSVKLPKELPGFTFEPTLKDEDSLGISLLTFFHRKKEGDPLEIIR